MWKAQANCQKSLYPCLKEKQYFWLLDASRNYIWTTRVPLKGQRFYAVFFYNAYTSNTVVIHLVFIWLYCESVLVEWFGHRASVFKVGFETRSCHCIISLSLSTLPCTSIPSNNYWEQKHSQLFDSLETEISL